MLSITSPVPPMKYSALTPEVSKQALFRRWSLSGFDLFVMFCSFLLCLGSWKSWVVGMLA